MSRIKFHVNPSDQAPLEAAGFVTFEDLMSKDAGTMIDSGALAQTHRLELPMANGPVVCYLKRTLGQTARKNFQFLSRGTRPHTNAYREVQLVLELQKHGVPAMRVMAWGEELRFGLPVRGFILVEQVPGELLHDLFLASDTARRRELIVSFAAFVAKLHTLGFYQTVRLKDLIYSDPPDGEASRAGSLTLIDRVAAKPGRKPFWSWFCLQSLRRGFRRMARDGLIFNSSEQALFAESYARNVATQWQVTGTEIEERLTR